MPMRMKYSDHFPARAIFTERSRNKSSFSRRAASIFEILCLQIVHSFENRIEKLGDLGFFEA
jgi:hypothetical protein